MQFTRLAIPEVVLITPKVIEDERGFFLESFRQDLFAQHVDAGVQFIQDNHSKSRARVLRGLHYQLPPHGQGKLVKVLAGSIFDVAVDVRAGSPTCGKWVGELLSADNKKQLWIPQGFAHGFLVLGDGAEVFYKTTSPYSPSAERAIAWDDPTIGLPWQDWLKGQAPIIAAKDSAAPAFAPVPWV